MSLEKLRPELAEHLRVIEISELNEFQNQMIDTIKGGQNLLIEAPDGSGKSTLGILSAMQKIEEPAEGSPRALIIVPDDVRARELYAKLQLVCKYLDLTVDMAHEKGNMLQQRNDLFDGTEIIIGTPKRVFDLYIQNGFNVSKLKLFVLDDTLELMKKGHKFRISRIAESLPKCQHLMFSETFNDKRIEEYLEEFIFSYKTIKFEPVS
ncbi:MAG: DEAD/DEAH box helicase [Bacteroidota bacterium]